MSTSRWSRLPWNARRNLGREVDEELRFHIDALVDELMAQGRSEREARDEAERRFGGVGDVRNECVTIDRRRKRRLGVRELLMMTMLDFRVAVRALRRAPVYSLAIIATLVIGIGAAAAIFTVVNAVLLRPLPYRNADRLVSIRHDLPGDTYTDAGMTPAWFFTYRAFSHTLSGIAMYTSGALDAIDPDSSAEHVAVAWATANLFPMLGVDAALGRTFAAGEDLQNGAPVVVISDGFWRSRFGADPNVIGKTIVARGRRTIVGVMPPNFHFPDATTQLWLPFLLSDTATYMGGYVATDVAQLAPGADIAAAQRELAPLLSRSAELYPMYSFGLTMRQYLDQTRAVPRVTPLKDELVGDSLGILRFVAAAAALVLLVTATNAMNLLLVRTDAKRRELSVRAALGAGTGRVLGHFLAESLLLAGLAAVVALGVAWAAVFALVHASPVQLPRVEEIHVDGSTVLFTAVISVLVAALCNAVPAMRFLRGGALSGLRDAGGLGRSIGASRQLARATLVTAQLALALAALVTSGLLVRSFERVRAIKPGFNADHVATLWVVAPPRRYRTRADFVNYFASLTRAVRQIPGVTDAGETSHIPLTEASGAWPMFVEGVPYDVRTRPPFTVVVSADAGYFRTMQIPLVAGRMFGPVEGERGDVAIVSLQTARDLFGDSTGSRVIGRRFQGQPGGIMYTVIGVVGSTRDTSLYEPPTRNVYTAESPVSADTVLHTAVRIMAVVARTNGDIDATLIAMRKAAHDLDPTIPTYDERPMAAVVNAQLAQLTFTMVVLGAAAGVTLVLGLLGLYGVIAYIVTLRTRELGLRIALGAAPIDISRMVARQGLVLAVVGTIGGLGLATLTTRLIKSFLFEVTPLDPTTLIAAVIALIACALLASWLPARRAARVDPAIALRAD